MPQPSILTRLSAAMGRRKTCWRRCKPALIYISTSIITPTKRSSMSYSPKERKNERSRLASARRVQTKKIGCLVGRNGGDYGVVYRRENRQRSALSRILQF